MCKYLFETTATMKPYNCRKWWIDSGIIRPLTVQAETIQKALEQYQKQVKERYYIEISNNTLTRKEPIFRDSANGEAVQVGYILTASTDFNNDHKGWVKQYIDLWINIQTVQNPFETEV